MTSAVKFKRDGNHGRDRDNYRHMKKKLCRNFLSPCLILRFKESSLGEGDFWKLDLGGRHPGRWSCRSNPARALESSLATVSETEKYTPHARGGAREARLPAASRGFFPPRGRDFLLHSSRPRPGGVRSAVRGRRLNRTRRQAPVCVVPGEEVEKGISESISLLLNPCLWSRTLSLRLGFAPTAPCLPKARRRSRGPAPRPARGPLVARGGPSSQNKALHLHPDSFPPPHRHILPAGHLPPSPPLLGFSTGRRHFERPRGWPWPWRWRWGRPLLASLGGRGRGI